MKLKQSINRFSVTATWTLILCCTIDNFMIKGAGGANTTPPAKQTTLQGALSQNELIDQLETMGIKCVIEQGQRDTLCVEDVRYGSAAYFKGVAKGDVVKSFFKSGATSFALTINRNGAVYQVQLRSISPTLAVTQAAKPAAIPVLDVTEPKPLVVDFGAQDKPDERSKKLLKYNIELIVDISGSMNEPDGTGDSSKFEWCHKQVRDLALKLAPYKKNVTITIFNQSFQTMENCSPTEVEQVYGSTTPVGGTNMVAPLVARIDNALQKSSSSQDSTLIAIITDGLPNVPHDPRAVNEALIDATRRMTSSDQVIITFLQVGATFDGRDFCVDLDNNLVNEGAKYDIVDTRTFAQLKSEGLVNALIDAVLEKKSVKNSSRSARGPGGLSNSRGVQTNLKETQQKRKALEEQLLRQ